MKLALTIFAVADAVAIQAAPAVVGEALGVAALDDLGENGGEVFVVVRAVDAGDVFIGGTVRIAGAVASEPIGMGFEKIFGGAIRIHARDDDKSFGMGGFGEIAVEVAIAEEFGAMLQGELAGVVGNDAARIDDDALDLGTLPEGAPPRDVVAGRVYFGDVGLAPARGAAVPGFGCSGGGAGRHEGDGSCGGG